MSVQALRFERCSRAILGALRFIDHVTGRTIRDAMRIDAPGLQFYRKTNGDIIVTAVDGAAVQPLDIEPSTSAYLPRRFVLTLPRPPDPGASDSIFKPAEIRLFPSPSYPVTGNGAALRVTVRKDATRERVGGALLRIVRTGDGAFDGAFEASSMTDAAGEALIVAANAPLAVSKGGTDFTQEISAILDIVADEALVRLVADNDVRSARASPFFPEPDGLEARRAALQSDPIPVMLMAGRIEVSSDAIWKP
jgi:hypothetical protein